MRSKTGEFRLNHPTTEVKKQPSAFKGLIFAVLSGFCYFTVAVIVKQVKNVHPGQLSVYRFIALFFLSMPNTVKAGHKLLGPRELRPFIIARGIASGTSLFLNFVAFRYLQLGEASVIIFSSPVIVTIFARVFFKEPCTIFQTISVILTVIGITFTAKLPSTFSTVPVTYSSEHIYGLLAAVISLVSVGIFVLLTRKVRSVHSSILNIHDGWVGALVVAILTAIFGNFKLVPCGLQTIYVLLMVSFSFGGISLFVLAIQCDYAGPVTTIRGSTDIGMAFLGQTFIFHDKPDTYGIIGAVLVLVSIFLITFDKWLASSEGNTGLKDKLKSLSI